jgi:hypothetical protein
MPVMKALAWSAIVLSLLALTNLAQETLPVIYLSAGETAKAK